MLMRQVWHTVTNYGGSVKKKKKGRSIDILQEEEEEALTSRGKGDQKVDLAKKQGRSLALSVTKSEWLSSLLSKGNTEQQWQKAEETVDCTKKQASEVQITTR